MEKRPRIKLKKNTNDIYIQILVGLTLLSLWALAFLNHSELPNEIPTHFNAGGEVDGYGDKRNLFDLPIIATIISLGIFFLNKIPHHFNYLSQITIENAQKEYNRATRMLRILSLLINITFLIIAIFTLNAVNNQSALEKWLLPFIVVTLSLLPVFMILNWSKKLKK